MNTRDSALVESFVSSMEDSIRFFPTEDFLRQRSSILQNTRSIVWILTTNGKCTKDYVFSQRKLMRIS